MIIRVVSNSLRIQCFMTCPSTDKIQKGAMKFEYIPTDQQVVDILTKPFAKGKFEAFRDKLGLVQNSFLTKREC
jgi:hypothetical protein